MTPRNPLLGMVRLARLRADAFAAFGAANRDYLASLAPVIALPIAGAVVEVVRGEATDGVRGLLLAVIAVLLPAVLAHEFARRLGREALWGRYATALNWAQWLVPAVVMTAAVAGGVLLAGGLPQTLVAGLLMAAVAIYLVALHWFLARQGLGLGRAASALFIVLIHVGTGAVLLLPAAMESGL